MKTAMDAGGRVVIPKALRDALGLLPGAAIEVDERDGTLVLQPVSVAKRLVRRGRGVVVEPLERLPKLTATDVRRALEAARR